MTKLRIALCLALISSVMTGLAGVLQGARPLTVLSRTCISLLVFSALGYIIGGFGGQLIGSLLQNQKERGQDIDIVSRQEPVHEDNRNSAFVPLTPEKLERVSRPNE